MIANWQVKPVGLNSVVRSSDHAADVIRVRVRRVEVCVITNKNWHLHLYIRSREHALSFLSVCQNFAAFFEDVLQSGSHFETCFFTEFDELVEGRFQEDLMVDVFHDRSLVKEPILL